MLSLLPHDLCHGWSASCHPPTSCHFLLHRIVPTQGLNPGLLHCRQILYHLSHQGSSVYDVCMYVCMYVCVCMCVCVCVCVCVCLGILLFFMSLSQSFTVFCLNYQNKSIPWTQILQLALLRGIQQLYGTEIIGNIYITVKYINMCVPYVWASQVALVVKNLPANVGDARDAGLIPGLGRSPGGGHGNPLQYSCLENPMDRGVWRSTVHGITQSWT